MGVTQTKGLSQRSEQPLLCLPHYQHQDLPMEKCAPVVASSLQLQPTSQHQALDFCKSLLKHVCTCMCAHTCVHACIQAHVHTSQQTPQQSVNTVGEGELQRRHLSISLKDRQFRFVPWLLISLPLSSSLVQLVIVIMLFFYFLSFQFMRVLQISTTHPGVGNLMLILGSQKACLYLWVYVGHCI